MRTLATPTPLEGVLVVEIEYYHDERGFFIENYHKQRFVELGIADDFLQDNHSRSAVRVLRGLHYQGLTAPMAKLIRCTAGAVFDVAVDLRVGSPTFGRWYGIELTAENMKQMYVPVGFAHGFATLSDMADVQYKCTGYYTPRAEGALAWDDPDVGIAWPVSDPILSPRDSHALSLRQYLERPAFKYGP